MKRYVNLWLHFLHIAIQGELANRYASLLFLFGKVLRFVGFTIFLFLLTSQTKFLAGYSVNQVLLFFLTFNLIDVLAQTFFRGAYRFRARIVDGSFDYYLIKPVSPLFRSLLTNTDVMDLLTLIPLAGMTGFIIWHAQSSITFFSLLVYLVLVVNGFLIALACHIMLVALCIITYEIDNTLWIYRDLVALGRVPIDIYKEPIRSVLTFVIPIAVMVSFPTKALFGLLSVEGMVVSVVVSAGMLAFAAWLWRYSLRRYASASS